MRRSRDGRDLAHAECVDAATALRAYTVDVAWAGHAERSRGRIAPGMLADFVLLGDDPTAVPAPGIGDIPVLATFVGGRCVHGVDTVADRTTGDVELGPDSGASSRRVVP